MASKRNHSLLNRRKNYKKRLTLITVLFIAVLLSAVTAFWLIPELRFQRAQKALLSGDTKTAVSLFSSLGDYRGSFYYLQKAEEAQNNQGQTPLPTFIPTLVPTATPTPVPTATPTVEPTPVPTATPTAEPTATPTPVPTATPTAESTATPTPVPTATPTPVPTATPTAEPTATPTPVPTATPTPVPTATPTPVPTATATAEPTATATPVPTATPTAEPTATPTPVPTATPTAEPTATPTPVPTATPTAEPTATPIPVPTATPTAEPTATPTPVPTATPTAEPTATPTPVPTATPTATPTPVPTVTPTVTPTAAPTAEQTAAFTPESITTSAPTATPDTTPAASADEISGQEHISSVLYDEIDRLFTPGNIVTLGTFEQDMHPETENDPLTWRVLRRDGDNALLINEYVPVFLAYSGSSACYWAGSQIRTWLNSDFLNAFNEKEIKAIQPTLISSQNEDTEDLIFILSKDELRSYFKDDAASRACTALCAFENTPYYGKNAYCYYWLRDAQPNSGKAYCVYSDGGSGLSSCGDTTVGVRPAMWINIRALAEEN